LRLKILKKLRTASLNSEFTGSYNKSVTMKLIRFWFGISMVIDVTTEWNLSFF